MRAASLRPARANGKAVVSAGLPPAAEGHAQASCLLGRKLQPLGRCVARLISC